jgi:hypothetical protein
MKKDKILNRIITIMLVMAIMFNVFMLVILIKNIL